MKKIFFLFLFILLMSGCKDGSNIEINKLGIVSALGVEKEGDEYILTAQIINIKKNTEQGVSETSDVITYTQRGRTIFEAARKITLNSSKKLYFTHMKLVIVDDSILNSNPHDLVDFFSRDSESMLNFYILASTEDKPDDILKTLTPFENIPAEYIVEVLKVSETNYGVTYLMTFEQYLDDLITEGVDPAFTKISLTSKDEKKNEKESLNSSELSSYIKLGNILVFDENEQLIELTEDESAVYNMIKNTAKNSVLTFTCKNEKYYYSVELLNEDVKVKFNEKKSAINFDINIVASISDYNCEEELLKDGTLDYLKKSMAKKLKYDMDLLFNKSLKYKSDFLGTGLHIKAYHKNYFDFKKGSWSEEGFLNVSLDANVKAELEKRGNLFDRVKEKEKYKNEG